MSTTKYVICLILIIDGERIKEKHSDQH